MTYIAWSVIAGETPTATKWNYLGGNDADFNTRLTSLETIPYTGEASDTTPTPTAGSVKNIYELTALAGNAAFNAPSGTPEEGDVLIIRITDNGSARTLTWDSVYRASSYIALPTTTLVNKTMYLGFIYNDTDNKWDLVSYIDDFT